MIAEIIVTDLKTPTASAGINANDLSPQYQARPVATAAGLRARGALIDSALRFSGFTITRHPAGYRLIVLERGRA